ncbi:MAG: ferric reductase-like transmembrane domain-containing protein [Actinomycetota bacterium]
MNAFTGSTALWYASRATGTVSIVLLTLVMLLGVGVSGRRTVPGLPKLVVLGLHRNASLLAVAFLAVHIVTAVVDPFVTIAWADALIPFHSSYQPLWLGLGAVAIDLLIAILITTALRKHISRGAWKVVHWSAYAVWPVALVHGIMTGPDLRSGPLLATSVACAALVAYAAAWRMKISRSAARRLQSEREDATLVARPNRQDPGEMRPALPA